jgi:hypothetical protein
MRVATALAALLVSCKSDEPPGATTAPEPSHSVVVAASDDPAAEPSSQGHARTEEGGPDDSLPFSPTADRVASIAWRTWVYTDSGP